MLLEWAPDGALLLVATTAPRLRVDNGLLVMSLHGEHLHRYDMQVGPLLSCSVLQPGRRPLAYAKRAELLLHCRHLNCLSAQALGCCIWYTD